MEIGWLDAMTALEIADKICGDIKKRFKEGLSEEEFAILSVSDYRQVMIRVESFMIGNIKLKGVFENENKNN